MIPNKSDHLGISLAETPPHSDHEEAVVLWRKELGRGALGHVDICESLALNPCRHCYSPTPFICGASEPGSPMSPSARCYIWKRRGGKNSPFCHSGLHWKPIQTKTVGQFFLESCQSGNWPEYFFGGWRARARGGAVERAILSCLLLPFH